VLGWARGGSGRLLLLGLLRVLPLLGIVVGGLPGSLGGRLTIGAELEVGLSAAALEGPCDVLPVVAKAMFYLFISGGSGNCGASTSPEAWCKIDAAQCCLSRTS